MAIAIFDKQFQGSASVAKDLWLDLGLIPTGYRIWLGLVSYTAINKVIAFDLRTNNAGQSAGTLIATASLSKVSGRAGCTVTSDLYRKGRLHVHSSIGTGVEKMWLHVTSKIQTAGDFLYQISYNQEVHA